MSTPLIFASGEIRDDILMNGARMLRDGAPAADVAEQIARDVEDDPEDHSVGTGGIPNSAGEVELDAAFMEGSTRRIGAVAALKGFRHPISIARQVMQRLPHVLLAGEGAARFAAEIGAERVNLVTDEAMRVWRERIDVAAPGTGDVAQVKDLIGFTNRIIAHRDRKAAPQAESHDTMNVIVRDAHGRLFVAVSTSGIAWKYPGRVGDSPYAGAGFYADDRYGAAACMGLGEWTMRHGSSLRAVLALSMGRTLHEAGSDTVRDMYRQASDSDAGVWFEEGNAPWVRLLLIDAHGNCGGYSTTGGLTYKTLRPGDAAPVTFGCTVVG